MNPVNESQNYSHLTATTTLVSAPGNLLGIFVASASATPTLAVSDGANIVVNTFTPSAGQWYAMPFRFGTSLIVTIGGTVDCTVSWGG